MIIDVPVEHCIISERFEEGSWRNMGGHVIYKYRVGRGGGQKQFIYNLQPQCYHIKTDKLPANKEPFLNQLAGVILVHNWYRSTSMCFHVNTHVLPVVTSRTGSELFTESSEFT